jgi:hypothetical protein
MVRLVFTGSQPKKDAKFFISALAHFGGGGGGVGSFSLREASVKMHLRADFLSGPFLSPIQLCANGG